MFNGGANRFAIVMAAALVVSATSLAAAPAAGATTIRVPVLMYHRIAQEPPAGSRFPDLYVTPAAFDAQLSALKARGWHTITAAALGEAIRARQPVPAGTFVITLDDGHVDGFTAAWPIMQKYRFVGTFFVVTGHIGHVGFLTWDMSAALAGAGNEIANHTMSHDSLPSDHGAALVAQIDDAASAIQTQLALRGVPTTVRTFAYPYGHTSPEATQLLAERGYDLAVTTVFATVPMLSAEPLLYPRVRVSRGETTGTFLATLGGARPIEWRGQPSPEPAGPTPPSGAPGSDSAVSPAPSATTIAAALPAAPPPTADFGTRAAPSVVQVHEPESRPVRMPTTEVLGIGGFGLLMVLLLTSAAMFRRKRR